MGIGIGKGDKAKAGKVPVKGRETRADPSGKTGTNKDPQIKGVLGLSNTIP